LKKELLRNLAENNLLIQLDRMESRIGRILTVSLLDLF